MMVIECDKGVACTIFRGTRCVFAPFACISFSYSSSTNLSVQNYVLHLVLLSFLVASRHWLFDLVVAGKERRG